MALSPTLAVVPVLWSCLPFASAVRRAVADWKPDGLVLELPQGLDEAILQGIEALPQISVVSWRDRAVSGEARSFPVDPCDARVEALRIALDAGIPAFFLDTTEAAVGTDPPLVPDGVATEDMGAADFARLYWQAVQPTPTDRHRTLAGRFARLGAEREGQRLLAVVGLGEAAAFVQLFEEGTPESLSGVEVAPDLDTTVEAPAARRLPLVLAETPYVTDIYCEWREDAADGDEFPAAEAIPALLRQAADQYAEEYDERVSLTEWRALSQFARHLALQRGRLRPGFYELVMAAKGCVGDDYGAIVLELATDYPPNHQENDDRSASYSDGYGENEPDETSEDRSRRQSASLYADFGDGVTRCEAAYPKPPLGEVSFRFRRRRPSRTQRERWREEFAMNSFFGMGICSWPPEDERIEAFFTHLRKRALSQVSDDRTVVEEAVGSLQDGLDLRETTRQWHTGKLYVRRERRPPGRVGPVALIWRDFPLTQAGLWRTTLYAENSNESDICVCCEQPGKEMVGPQISRTEYHGILSIYPARGIPNLWTQAMLYPWGTCARLLIAAGILLCEDKFMAVVADKPPDAELKALAREQGVGLIYMPMASFSRKTLRRLRQVHILASHAARGWAGDYIGE